MNLVVWTTIIFKFTSWWIDSKEFLWVAFVRDVLLPIRQVPEKGGQYAGADGYQGCSG